MEKTRSPQWLPLLWDAWCAVSVIGIWPRWIEPNWLRTSRVEVPIDRVHAALDGLSIVHLSDLHFHRHTPDRFLQRITRIVQTLSPDIVVFTGDWICHSQLENADRLAAFLKTLKAPFGNFCSLGNHDYKDYVTSKGDGSIVTTKDQYHLLEKGFRCLVDKWLASPSEEALIGDVALLPKLVDLIKDSPFRLLENETIQAATQRGALNICGLGDVWAGRCDPETAYSRYDKGAPGLVLSHNPDTISLLQHYPGDLILSGHHHGGQVNIPGIWRAFTPIQHPKLKRGLHHYAGKQIYISRGLGGKDPFRWGASPEIVHITLRAR